ncbi:MAG: hypothetical protein IPK13_25470 [Deltaproteobacteria bacterium]|nr:hypothetical protein [Deltaproteobacteria bacterium]
MLELPETLPLRTYRLSARYTASRMNAYRDAQPLAHEFEEASEKFALLEAEAGQIAVAKADASARVAGADDAWDETMLSFRAHLLQLSGYSVDAPLYRRYFADIPSHVTSLSFAAEIMISRELEAALGLADEARDSLIAFADMLRTKREKLESAIREQTRVEVMEARFLNRVALAQVILNDLRQRAHSTLVEIASRTSRPAGWAARFFELMPPDESVEDWTRSQRPTSTVSALPGDRSHLYPDPHSSQNRENPLPGEPLPAPSMIEPA